MRTFIKEIVTGEYINAIGWITSIEEDGFTLTDFSGDIYVNYHNISDIGYRDVVSVTGKCILNMNSKYIVEDACVRIINKSVIDKKYMKSFLLYNLSKERIEILRRENFMRNIVRNYLLGYDFIETAVPQLWKTVKEYGSLEWGIHNPITGKECYKLLQSPNIINLILSISGIERSFQFAKCFRIPEENNFKRTDALVEFHQLAITSTFLSNEEGMKLIEGLMAELVYKLYGEKIVLPFPRYDFSKMNLLYCSDKHDMRLKDYFAPDIKKIKDCNMVMYMFPYDDIETYLSRYLKYYKKKCGIENLIYTIGRFEKIEGKLSNLLNLKEELQKIINCNYEKYTYLLLKYDEKFGKEMCNQFFIMVSNFIEKIKNQNIERFNFYWVEKYPYIKDPEKGTNGLGQNLFTKKKGDESYAFDLILNGFEIASGGEKNCDTEEFIQNIDKLELNRNEYDYFIQILKSGAPQLFSIGIGWERIVWKLLNTKNIQDIMLIHYDQSGDNDIW